MSARWVRRVFTGNGTWTCPAGVRVVFLRGVGGGGGGGRGEDGTTTTGVSPSGGGGGGGAKETTIAVDVVPGVTYDVIIGTGGAGGAGGVDGDNGTDTYIKAQGTGAGIDLARFVGASGGKGNYGLNNNAFGGYPMRVDTTFFNWYNPMPGLGGFGSFSGDAFANAAGGASHHGGGQTADNGGLAGANDGAYMGGGGGGGGGGGATPNTGGQGGAGGVANAVGAGGNGFAGTQAGPTQYGAGGGGGGGGGGGFVAQSGGNGGAGGPGRLVIEYVE